MNDRPPNLDVTIGKLRYGVRLGAILALAATATVLLVYAYYSLGYRPADDPSIIRLGPADLQLVIGRGESESDRIRIDAPGNEGYALISSAALRLDTALITQLDWSIDGLDDTVSVDLLWATRRDPNTLRSLSLAHSGESHGRLSLGEITDWTGHIGAIGLRITGQWHKPLTLGELVLSSGSISVSTLLAELATEWRFMEPWNDQSINFHVGGPRPGHYPATLIVTLWVLIAALMSVVAQRWGWLHRSWYTLATIGLLGWFALDARWQWVLWQRGLQTHTQFAGKSIDEKHRADRDGELYGFVRELDHYLPDQPAQIFLTSHDPEGSSAFQRLRAHYHLLPHNVFSLHAYPPNADEAEPGDFVILLQPVHNIQYQTAPPQLTWNDAQHLPVELVYAAEQGYLFKVRPEG